MNILIVEDDFISRRLLLEFLQSHGRCDVAVNGTEAVSAFAMALARGEIYDLVCLDIMMPGQDGYQTLKSIRQMEAQQGILLGQGAKVFMTTSLNDSQNVIQAFKESCDAYIVKPVNRQQLVDLLREHVPQTAS